MLIKLQKPLSFKLYVVILLGLPACTGFAQTEDSLLKKIKEIEVSLDAPTEDEENLFMNTVSFQSFYDELLPMGDWLELTKEDLDQDLNDGEGQSITDEKEMLFVWKPNVSSGWKPYMNGKWEYTDHGWLWISSDSWGNTTYNYGRWWNSPKYGWVWLPGYTWSPSWVRWKSSAGHVGWTALTPKARWKSENGITGSNYKYQNNDNDWVFVSDNNFADELSSSNVVSSSQNSALTKSGTDIVDIRMDNDKIVNTGPDVNEMEKRTGRKFQTRRVKFTRGEKKPVVSNDNVTISREKFRKYNFDSDPNKNSIDKPKKYKKSERVKKIKKQRQEHKQRPGRRKPGK